MKAGPDISRIAALVGDPARCNMLTALMTGRALTASELAQEAGITPQTASSHLSKLEAGGLIEPEKQGRHRYYRLSDPDVADVLEGLQGIAARAGHMRVRTGPKDPALRRARICYDHLAGDLGVQMLDSMKRQKLVRQSKQAIELTGEGKRFMAEELQIDADALTHPRRPVCKACLDWSERRHHLAGTLGACHDGPLHRTEMGRARCCAGQPRGQFFAQRREAIRRAVRPRPVAARLPASVDEPPVSLASPSDVFSYACH
ncbi:DNA-binding transcriptional ArsR family regulator [Bradyrhizobium elkanii]